DTRIKVEMSLSNYLIQDNIKTSIDQFIVTDEDGIQYIFLDKEIAQTCTYSKARYPDEEGKFSLEEEPPFILNPEGIPVFIGQKTQSYIVTKWYLTKILNPRTNKTIYFKYEE